MRLPRVPFGLVVPVLLLGLAALLASLQYQWLGKVSEAEREQLRRSLDQRAREFADDFDGEITRLYVALQAARPTAPAAVDAASISNALDRWRNAARFPGMVRGVYLAEAPDAEHRTLRQYDAAARVFGAPQPWPAHLEPLRAQLAAAALPGLPRPDGTRQVVAISLSAVAPDVPALLVPISGPVHLQGFPPPRAIGTVTQAKFWLQWPASHIVVDIDANYLRHTVLPALVARHFSDQGPDGYRLAIVSSGGATVFVRGLSNGATIDPARADVVMSFFSVRLESVRDLAPTDTLMYRAQLTGPGAAAGQAAGSQRMAVVVEHRAGVAMATGSQVKVVRPAWRLVLRHPAGSLDAAVGQARLRNLWLSFGILAVLSAGVGLVLVNARRASQLAARQIDFVATVSHELRTPVAVIRSAAQNLAAGVISEPEQARRYGQLIEDEGRRLTEMVEQVLDYAGIGGGRLRNPRAVDVRQLLEDAAASCRPLCEQSGVALDVVVPDDLPPIAADAAAMQRALHNLVVNAVKHAEAGRWVRVAADVASVRGRREVRISVTDRGPGIDAADLPHVFEPFYRGREAVSRQVHGNGLGLSLVKRVAEAHGGTVTVKSVAGEGSVFTLHLPMQVPGTDSAQAPVV